MKISYTAMAVAAALLAGTAAQATTLSFDALNGQYGDGSSLGADMTSDGQALSYTEAGYILTLHTTNEAGSDRAHIGDVGDAGTFNWHDSEDNQAGAYVTLTKVGGGNFKLVSLDFSNSNTGLWIDNGGTSEFIGTGPGSYFPSLGNVNYISFSSSDDSDNVLDNIVLTSNVPEPATWAMMLAGFGIVGAAVRRRQKVAVSFG